MATNDLLTPEEIEAAKLADMDDDEREALAEIAGDDDESKDEDDAAAAASGDDDATADDKSDDEDTDESDEDDRPAPEPTFAPQYHAGDPASFDAQLKGVRESRAELTKKWRDGEIEDADYDAKIAELDDAKDTIIEQRAAARLTASMNEQASRQAFERDKANFVRTMDKYESVPYGSNPMIRSAFESELRSAAERAIAEKRDPSAQELFEEAHAGVVKQLAALGVQIGRKPKADPKPTEPEARAPRNVPKTLSGMPAAAPASTASDDLMTEAAQLEGEELEVFIARLSPEKRRALENAQ